MATSERKKKCNVSGGVNPPVVIIKTCGFRDYAHVWDYVDEITARMNTVLRKGKFCLIVPFTKVWRHFYRKKCSLDEFFHKNLTNGVSNANY